MRWQYAAARRQIVQPMYNQTKEQSSLSLHNKEGAFVDTLSFFLLPKLVESRTVLYAEICWILMRTEMGPKIT